MGDLVYRRAPHPVRIRKPGDGNSDPSRGEHVGAMREKSAEQFHTTSPHYPRRVHICKQRFLGIAGSTPKVVEMEREFEFCGFQDGTFSLADFSEAFQEIEVLRVIRAYENGISLDIHCAPEGDWTRLPKEPFTKSCKVRVNPNDVLTAGSPSISSFINYLEPFLIPAELENILESSDVVGNIRFSRPTLYVFPGGQGDAALFGINGFNMLLDGGFSRKACFWDFVRHLDRLDAVLLTRLNNSNVNGISAVLRRKRQNAVYPQIGHFFCNIQVNLSSLFSLDLSSAS